MSSSSSQLNLKKRKFEGEESESGECLDPSKLTWNLGTITAHVMLGNKIEKDVQFLSGKSFDFIHCSYIVATGGAVHHTYLPCSRDPISGTVKRLNLPGGEAQTTRLLDVLKVTSNVADNGPIYFPPGSSYAVVFADTVESSDFLHASGNTWRKSRLPKEDSISKAVCKIAQAKLPHDAHGLRAFVMALSSYLRAHTPDAEFRTNLTLLASTQGVAAKTEAAVALSRILTGSGARAFVLSFGIQSATVEGLAEFIRDKSYRTAISSILGCDNTSHLPLLAQNTPFTQSDGSPFVSKPLNELTGTEFVLLSTTRADYNSADLFGRAPDTKVLVSAVPGPVNCIQLTGKKRNNKAKVRVVAGPGAQMRTLFEALNLIVVQDGPRGGERKTRELLVESSGSVAPVESFVLDI